MSDEAGSWQRYVVVVGMTASLPLIALVGLRFNHFTGYPLASLGVALAAGVCYFLGNAAFFAALSRLDASVCAAALATIPAMTTLGSWFVLGQGLRWLAIGGVASITLGILLMVGIRLGAREQRQTGASNHAAWMLLTAAAFLYTGEYILEGHAVARMAPIDVLLWTRVAIVGCGIALVLWRPGLGRAALDWAWGANRRTGVLSVTNELLDVAAVGLLITAYSRGPVGLSTAVAYSQPVLVFAVTLALNQRRPGTIPTDEDLSAQSLVFRGVGACAVVAGVVLVVA